MSSDPFTGSGSTCSFFRPTRSRWSNTLASSMPKQLRRRPSGPMRISTERSSLSWASHGLLLAPTASGCPRDRRSISACPRKRSGSAPRAAEWKALFFPGVTSRRSRGPATVPAGKPARKMWRNRNQTPTDCSRCARTCTNGAVTGSMRHITWAHRNAIHRGPLWETENPLVADRGGIRSKSPAAPPVPASHPILSMPTMVSVLPPTQRAARLPGKHRRTKTQTE